MGSQVPGQQVVAFPCCLSLKCENSGSTAWPKSGRRIAAASREITPPSFGNTTASSHRSECAHYGRNSHGSPNTSPSIYRRRDPHSDANTCFGSASRSTRTSRFSLATMGFPFAHLGECNCANHAPPDHIMCSSAAPAHLLGGRLQDTRHREHQRSLESVSREKMGLQAQTTNWHLASFHNHTPPITGLHFLA